MSWVSIIAFLAWVALEAAVSIMTAGHIPDLQWWIIVGGSLAIAVLMIVGGFLDRRAHRREIADIKAGQGRHSQEHEVIAQGTLAALDKLAAVTSTMGQSRVTTVDAAVGRIETLEATVRRHDAIFWGAINDGDKRRLTATLTGLGKHSISITAHENTDCVELARDLRACFRNAGWDVARTPLTGTYASAGASGLKITSRPEQQALHKDVFHAILGAVHGPIQGMSGGPPADTNRPDFMIVVGPKRVNYDDE